MQRRLHWRSEASSHRTTIAEPTVNPRLQCTPCRRSGFAIAPLWSDRGFYLRHQGCRNSRKNRSAARQTLEGISCSLEGIQVSATQNLCYHRSNAPGRRVHALCTLCPTWLWHKTAAEHYAGQSPQYHQSSLCSLLQPLHAQDEARRTVRSFYSPLQSYH